MRSKGTERKSEKDSRVMGFFRKYCSEEWIALLDHYRKKEFFRKGDMIFREGDPVKGMFVIVEGKAKVISSFDSDKIRIIRLARDGHVLGFRGFGGKWLYPVTAVALTDLEAIMIPNNVFNQVLKGNNELIFYFLESLTDELRRTEELTKRMTFMEVRERVACAIISLIRIFGFDKEDPGLLAFTISRQDFADYTGTTYESVVRTLSDLAKNGIIRIEGKALRILDRAALHTIITSNAPEPATRNKKNENAL